VCAGVRPSTTEDIVHFNFNADERSGASGYELGPLTCRHHGERPDSCA
jgi:hypothetical protein